MSKIGLFIYVGMIVSPKIAAANPNRKMSKINEKFQNHTEDATFLSNRKLRIMNKILKNMEYFVY